MKKRPHLIQKRKEHKLKQEEVAGFLNVTNRHYQALESGDSDGSVKIWQQLAQRFNTTADYLWTQEGGNGTQPDCSISRKGKKGGIAEAKALNEAAKKFDITDVALDVADNGRIDDPLNRRNAQEYCEAIGAALV